MTSLNKNNDSDARRRAYFIIAVNKIENYNKRVPLAESA